MTFKTLKCLFIDNSDLQSNGLLKPEVRQKLHEAEVAIMDISGHDVTIIKNREGRASNSQGKKGPFLG